MRFIRALAAFSVLAMACFLNWGNPAGAQGDGGKLYTRCNIWHEKESLPSINFKTGTIVPAGTEVKDVKIVERGRVRKVREIQFTIAKSGETLSITYEPRYSPGQSIEELKGQFISNQSFEELTKGFTEKELDCIKNGILKEGISKKAVLVAYGYPPKHKTPSTEGNEWHYWINRVRQKLVTFDANGMTTTGRVIEGGEI